MAEYLIELPHTKAECMKAIDEISEKGSEFFPKIYWGCGSGVHNGWAIINAACMHAVSDIFSDD